MSESPETPSLSADQINKLFDEAEHKLNFPANTNRRERWIFEQVFGESQDTLKRMWAFTRDVTTCPVVVIEFVKRLSVTGGTMTIAERRGLAVRSKPSARKRGRSNGRNFDSPALGK